jgi:5-methylcytosine-specific restriction endonuclease McrA
MPAGVYRRTAEHLALLAKARTHIVRKPHSEETKRKIGLANRGVWIKFNCDYCGKENEEKQSHYERKKRHFCNMQCYSGYRKEKLPCFEQPAYKGVRLKGETKQVYHRRYTKTHPENIAHLKARRYARERNSKGSHSLIEWQDLKRNHNFRCAICGQKKPLTKDHIIPLSEGGTDGIDNIQPLCRNCNSKKWKKLVN